MNPSLTSFLLRVRSAVFQSSLSSKTTIVLGNSSADLDSFISAVVLSYFHTHSPNNVEDRLFVPLLNLPSVPASGLWRMRPEYGTALQLAVQQKKDGEEMQDQQDKEKKLLQQLITIADLQYSPSSRLHSLFAEPSKENAKATSTQAEAKVILVDHNAPAVAGFSSTELSNRLTLIGVIDHHVEESVVPSTASPRIVTTGIGSCTSLVVQHLQDAELWAPPSSTTSPSFKELAKLAMAPILIDTANLKATGDKISDVDRNAVKFLESHILPSEPEWARTEFYEAIQAAKSNSLNLLTMREIFERDYKEWTELPKSSSSDQDPSELNIGIASLVRDIPWLIKHAGSADDLVTEVHKFARGTEHDLSLLALITKGNGPNGEFRKELIVVAYGEVAVRALEGFEREGGEELKLGGWDVDKEFLEKIRQSIGKEKGGGTSRVWWQGDVSKSRKQVAPLLREAAKTA